MVEYTTDNQRLIERWYDEMWNHWNKAIFPDILSERLTFRGSLGLTKHGYDGLSAYMDTVRAAFPDFHNQIELVITEGHQSFAKLTYRGTHQGTLFGIEPTHREVHYAGSAVFTIAAGKIYDVWVLGDVYGLIAQLR